MSRIIFIDDDPTTLRTASFIARKGGASEISCASSGAEGLEMIRAGLHELVFIDAEMPVMDGFKVLEALYTPEGLGEMTVYIMSGTVTEELTRRALGAGAKGVIKKPFAPAELINIIKSHE